MHLYVSQQRVFVTLVWYLLQSCERDFSDATVQGPAVDIAAMHN